jgi:hypothetical protein
MPERARKLESLRALVLALEAGQTAGVGKASVPEAMDAICGTAWSTPEQREEAQSLVGRLERLRHRSKSGHEGGGKVA